MCFLQQEACEARLLELQQEIRATKNRSLFNIDLAVPPDDAEITGFTLVIDGRTLDFALQKDLQKVFLDVTVSCRSVICCRSTPLQKSQVVRLVGDSQGVMTLAIGQYVCTLKVLLLLFQVSQSRDTITVCFLSQEVTFAELSRAIFRDCISVSMIMTF